MSLSVESCDKEGRSVDEAGGRRLGGMMECFQRQITMGVRQEPRSTFKFQRFGTRLSQIEKQNTVQKAYKLYGNPNKQKKSYSRNRPHSRKGENTRLTVPPKGRSLIVIVALIPIKATRLCDISTHMILRSTTMPSKICEVPTFQDRPVRPQ